jgi:hypothetical protein
MRARPLFAKLAVLLCSLVLVSGYVLQRSGGGWFFASAGKREPRPRYLELMPGPKAGKVHWDNFYSQLTPAERDAFHEHMRKEIEKDKNLARHRANRAPNESDPESNGR